MKKTKLFLLSLIALSLTGCGETISSSDSSANTSKSDTSAITDTGSGVDSSVSTDSSSISESASESSGIPVDDYDSSKWPTDVKDKMIKYLDNTLLPYIDLGVTATNVKANWDNDTDTLEVAGAASADALTADAIAAAETTYKTYGWIVTTDDTSMTAKRDEDGTITVKYYNNGAFNVIEAVYHEPYDESKAATSWPDSIIDEMDTNLHNHGNDVPYVYLGTVNPTFAWDSDHVTFKIYGGQWDDKITAFAKAAFEAANEKITEADNKWIIDEIGDGTYGKTFHAAITFSDGVKLSISIDAPDTGKKPMMNIVYTQPFGGTSTAWSNYISSFMTSGFHGHSVPFFFCGTESDELDDNITSEIDGSLIRFYGTENTWNDQVFDNVRIALNAENATITNDAEKWTVTTKTQDSDASKTALVATRTFSDLCTLSVQVQEDSTSHRADILIQYEKGYIPADGATWNDWIVSDFEDYLDGYTVPYIYLGNDDPEDDYESWDDVNTLTITGGSYFKALISGANKVFNATTGWTSNIVTKTGTNYAGETYSYDVVEAEYVIDATTGKKLTVTVDASNHNTNTGEGYGSSVLTITYVKPYVVPTDPEELKWDENASNNITANFSGHTLPFVYLGASVVDVIYDEYTNTIYITGGVYDDKVLAHALTQLSGSTQSTDDDGNACVKATIAESDGCSIEIMVHKDYYGMIEYKATLTEVYTADATKTAWDDDTLEVMKTVLGGNVLPYFDIGAKHFTAEAAGTTTFKLTSHVFNEAILTDALSNDGVDGWSFIKNSYYDNEVEGFKTFDDGSTVTVKVVENDGLNIFAYYHAKTEIAKTKSAWSDNDKAKILTITGTTDIPNIPFLYMGESDYAVSSNSLTGNVYDITTAIDYFNVLKDAGYQVVCFRPSTNQFNITAEYTDADGNVTKLVTSYSSKYSYGKITVSMKLTITYTAATTAE